MHDALARLMLLTLLVNVVTRGVLDDVTLRMLLLRVRSLRRRIARGVLRFVRHPLGHGKFRSQRPHTQLFFANFEGSDSNFFLQPPQQK